MEEMFKSQLQHDGSETGSVKHLVSGTSKIHESPLPLPLTFMSPRVASVKLGARNSTGKTQTQPLPIQSMVWETHIP